MPRVRYTDDGGRYRVADETFEPGDEAEVSDGLASHLVDDVGRFERVDSDDASDDGNTADADGDEEDVGVDLSEEAVHPAAEPPFNPSDLTVAEIEERLEDGDYDEPDLLALYSAEAESKERQTALDAIRQAEDELEG